VVGVALSAVWGLAASAADMPYKTPAPAIVAASSWTGFYIGVHGGAGWGTSASDIDISGVNLQVASHNINGAIGGGQIGLNYQISSWLVVGIEGAGSWAGLKGTTPCVVIGSCTNEIKWLANVTGRAGGIVGGNTLVYVKGGAVWARNHYDASFLSFVNATATATRLGYLIGGGAEYRFANNWYGFGEYNFMDFGRQTIDFDVSGSTAPVNVRNQTHLLKAGINYKF
jgi:outer membrane immunogenic protein